MAEQVISITPRSVIFGTHESWKWHVHSAVQTIYRKVFKRIQIDRAQVYGLPIRLLQCRTSKNTFLLIKYEVENPLLKQNLSENLYVPTVSGKTSVKYFSKFFVFTYAVTYSRSEIRTSASYFWATPYARGHGHCTSVVCWHLWHFTLSDAIVHWYGIKPVRNVHCTWLISWSNV